MKLTKVILCLIILKKVLNSPDLFSDCLKVTIESNKKYLNYNLSFGIAPNTLDANFRKYKSEKSIFKISKKNNLFSFQNKDGHFFKGRKFIFPTL